MQSLVTPQIVWLWQLMSRVVKGTGGVLNFIKHTGLHKRGLTINNIDNIIYFHIWHMTNLEF